MNETFITPNMTVGICDSDSIAAAIKKAISEGIGKIVIPRYNERTEKDLWIIEKTIYLPSDIEIIIDDAHLILADGIYANMFATENILSDDCSKQSGEQKNITIRGNGRATLDGGNYNGLSERTSEKDGRPHISKNTTLLFVNASNITVENIRILNQRWWAVTNVFVHDSIFRNIYFKADLSRIDENGVHHPDELPRNYDETYIKNADGIDLRVGCHDILIENITGFTEDDTIALTALGNWEAKYGYIVDGLPTDIHDVKIKNITADPYICSVVRLLNDNGHKLYNINIDGVNHLGNNRGYQTKYAVRIGDMIYAHEHSILGDTHHITVKNVTSHARYAVALCKGIVDSSIENITVLDGGIYAIGTSEQKGAYAEIINCSLRNIILADSDVESICGNNIIGSFTML